MPDLFIRLTGRGVMRRGLSGAGLFAGGPACPERNKLWRVARGQAASRRLRPATRAPPERRLWHARPAARRRGSASTYRYAGPPQVPPFQVRLVAGDLRLAGADLKQEAHTGLLAAHQVEQAHPHATRQGAKVQLQVEALLHDVSLHFLSRSCRSGCSIFACSQEPYRWLATSPAARSTEGLRATAKNRRWK